MMPYEVSGALLLSDSGACQYTRVRAAFETEGDTILVHCPNDRDDLIVGENGGSRSGDRPFWDGESIKLDECEFTARHSPGQTEYRMAMFGNVDGAGTFGG